MNAYTKTGEHKTQEQRVFLMRYNADRSSYSPGI